MRTPFNALVTLATLRQIDEFGGGGLLDVLGDDPPVQGLQNVCARVSQKLSDDVSEVSKLLGISKRRFLESCMIQGVAEAWKIIEAEGLIDLLVRDDEDVVELEKQDDHERRAVEANGL